MHGVNSDVTERYARFFATRHGLSVTVPALSNVYGPGQTGRRGQGVIAAWCRALALDEPITVFGELEARRDFVYADDAAAATVAAGLSGTAGAFNVGSGVDDAAPRGSQARRRGGRTRPARPSAPCARSGRQRDRSRLLPARERHRLAPRTSLVDGARRSWEWISDRVAVGPSGAGLALDALHRTD